MPAARLARRLLMWHHVLAHPRVARRRTTRCAVRYLGPSHKDRRRRHVSRLARARRYHAFDDEEALLRARRAPDCRGEGHRLVPGANGVRSARARVPQHHRRSALDEDAAEDEREDQVPGSRSGRSRRRVLREHVARLLRHAARSRTARTCCWSRPCSTSKRAPGSAEQMQGLAGIDRLNVVPLGGAGDHARRLLGAHADCDAERQRPLLPVDEAFARGPAVR